MALVGSYIDSKCQSREGFAHYDVLDNWGKSIHEVVVSTSSLKFEKVPPTKEFCGEYIESQSFQSSVLGISLLPK